MSKISLGIVMILIWVWMWLRVDLLFPVNTLAMKDTLLTYIIFTTLIFSFNALASEKTEKVLFKVSFLKAMPKFLLSAGISLVILFLFGLIIKGESLIEIAIAISGIGLGVILLHAVFVSTMEELGFRGWLTNELMARGIRKYVAWIMSACVFAFFHYLLNGEWLTLIIYIPLGLIFQFVKEKFSPKTGMANSGCHFAWNIWILLSGAIR